MAENKRFTIDVETENYENAYFEEDKFLCYEDDYDAILKRLNELAEENQELKHRISEAAGMEFQLLNRDIEQLQKEIKDIEKAKDDFYDRVFRLIDEKIDECTIMECDCSDCAGSQLLKELKEELKS